MRANRFKDDESLLYTAVTPSYKQIRFDGNPLDRYYVEMLASYHIHVDGCLRILEAPQTITMKSRFYISLISLLAFDFVKTTMARFFLSDDGQSTTCVSVMHFSLFIRLVFSRCDDYLHRQRKRIS